MIYTHSCATLIYLNSTKKEHWLADNSSRIKYWKYYKGNKNNWRLLHIKDKLKVIYYLYTWYRNEEWNRVDLYRLLIS
jgi:hypothetical protein